MKHEVNAEQLGDLGLPIVEAIQKCVHCGFCLPTCPTYQVLEQEMDSPRGRILLMKEVLEGNLAADEAATNIDRCLGCVACEPACPSGVGYGDLLSAYRAATRSTTKRTWGERFRAFLTHQTVPHPSRFRWAIRLSRIAAPFASIMPSALKPMLNLVPESIPRPLPLPVFSAATNARIGQVGLLTGCAQQILAPEINLATIRVLNHIGYDVVIPKKQTCCGGLDWHEGRLVSARQLASRNLKLFSDDLAAIITNAAGCGSAINDYRTVFSETSLLADAESFSNRVQDIAVFLAAHPPISSRFRTPTRVAYHDACHLANAQGILDEPRELLSRIQNVQLVELLDGGRCCGSAGTYNLQQPEIANQLGQLKSSAISVTDCQIVAAGNIGCLVQIRKHLPEHSDVEALHPIEILNRSIQD